MKEQMSLKVEAREERGKNAARRLRATGMAPATVYGLEQEPVAIAVDTKEITRILSHTELRNRVLNLEGGASGTAMASDYQIDPVTGRLLHVDFRRVAMDKLTHATIPLRTFGLAYGVKNEGGLEDVILREAAVECLPADLPEKIEIDVSELRSGESIRIRDLDAGEGVRFLDDPSAVVVRIVGKRGQLDEEAEDAAAAAAAAEGEGEGEAETAEDGEGAAAEE